MADPLQIDIRRPRGVRRPVLARPRNLAADQYTSMTIVVPVLTVVITGVADNGWWSFTPPDGLALAAPGRYPYELIVDRGLINEVPVVAGLWIVTPRVGA